MRNLELSKIRIDGGTQPREAIDQTTVDEYAEAIVARAEFPPLVVFFDGVHAWLADGFHRYHGARKANWQTFDVDWREGTLEMAKLYAAGANAEHGKRRTSGDRRRAIEMVWATEQGRRWTQDQIAKHCHVTQQYVSRVLGEIQPVVNSPPCREQKRAAVVAATSAHPEASHREIARKVGVDHKTVAKMRAEASSPRQVERMVESDEGANDDRGVAPPVASAPATQIDYDNRTQREAAEGAIAALDAALGAWRAPVAAMVADKLMGLLRRHGYG